MSTAAHTQSDLVLVGVADDKMSVTVKLRRPRDSVTREDVLDALQARNVVVDDGVRERVDAFVDVANQKTPPKEAFVVATGRPAQGARNETLAWDARFDAVAAEWHQDVPPDFYARHAIVVVEKGATLGSIVPGAPSVDGADVEGSAIPAEGAPQPLRLHRSVGRSAEDPLRIIARGAGRVLDNGCVLRVEETLQVPADVDFESGNIDATVHVYIHGKITDLFEVKTTRSVTVGGAIEAARVTAGGDVVVRRGIVGRKSGLVCAGGDIVAKHTSEANLFALGDVRIAKQLMNSHVCVCGTLRAATAAIIGGSVHARGIIDVQHLGSDANVPTRIVAGVHPESVREVALIDQRVTQTEALIAGIEQSVEPLLSAPETLDDTQRSRARDLIAKAGEAAGRVDELKQRRAALLDHIYADENASVCVSGQIRANVKIRIGDRETLFNKDLKGPVVIEKRKIKNVTQVVAVDPRFDSVKVLTSERCTPEELFDGFALEQPPERGL